MEMRRRVELTPRNGSARICISPSSISCVAHFQIHVGRVSDQGKRGERCLKNSGDLRQFSKCES